MWMNEPIRNEESWNIYSQKVSVTLRSNCSIVRERWILLVKDVNEPNEHKLNIDVEVEMCEELKEF